MQKEIVKLQRRVRIKERNKIGLAGVSKASDTTRMDTNNLMANDMFEEEDYGEGEYDEEEYYDDKGDQYVEGVKEDFDFM